jgi:predicted ATPase
MPRWSTGCVATPCGPRAQLDTIWLTEVARLLPELLVEHPALPAPEPLTESWQRQRLFESLARTFLSAHMPLLLIDDLQWCDQETLEWLRYLLRFAPHAELLVVGTIRAEEVVADDPLRALLIDLHRTEQITEITLKPLNAGETAALAAQIAGQDIDAGLAAQLYQKRRAIRCSWSRWCAPELRSPVASTPTPKRSAP